MVFRKHDFGTIGHRVVASGVITGIPPNVALKDVVGDLVKRLVVDEKSGQITLPHEARSEILPKGIEQFINTVRQHENDYFAGMQAYSEGLRFRIKFMQAVRKIQQEES